MACSAEGVVTVSLDEKAGTTYAVCVVSSRGVIVVSSPDNKWPGFCAEGLDVLPGLNRRGYSDS